MQSTLEGQLLIPHHFGKEISLRSLILILSLGVCGGALAKPLLPREVPRDVYLDRSGMPELVAQSTAVWALITPILTTNFFEDDIRKSSGFILGPVLGASLPFLLNQDKPLYTTEALTYNFFQRVGVANGLIIPAFMEDPSTKAFAISAAGLTLAGLGAGVALYPSLKLSPGQISMLSSGLGFGGLTGMLLLVAASSDDLPSRQTIASTLLVSVNGGALTAYLLRDMVDIDRSRVIWMDFGGAVGGVLGVGLGFMIGGEDANSTLVSLSALAGIYGGIVAAYKITAKHDEYLRAAPPEQSAQKSKKVTLNGPMPTLIPGVNPRTRRAIFTPGVNLLNGTW